MGASFVPFCSDIMRGGKEKSSRCVTFGTRGHFFDFQISKMIEARFDLIGPASAGASQNKVMEYHRYGRSYYISYPAN